MDVRDCIDQIFGQFSKKYQLPLLKLNQEGIAALRFDEKLQVCCIFLPEQELLALQIDIADLSEVSEGIFRQLASFNRYWYQFNLHFGFDETSLKIQLYSQITISNLTLDKLEHQLTSILDHAEFWQELLCEPVKKAVYKGQFQGMKV
ncbi:MULTISPECIES: type III secretion system chaperone [unclassified Arsenophonus]|uniref:type III secretion system chaperone n=1 Tax=unclassified Arsenophonus TaxID=2627083 RepID=UPI002866551E|nr:type III secretion system chaperone [Arsenophonus sp.]MDR5611055.1 type III secretion system chaperone [Arsenophonus sp.]MDR5614997.1 type III secretion system chaperone [Arsenophonus sp.]